MSSSNEIKRFIVVFVPLQLTLGRVVERRRDHVHLLYNLPNDTTLDKKILTSSVFLVTEILVIEDRNLHSTFFYVAFGLQMLLKSTSN
jgi:hypothetical protein